MFLEILPFVSRSSITQLARFVRQGQKNQDRMQKKKPLEVDFGEAFRKK